MFAVLINLKSIQSRRLYVSLDFELIYTGSSEVIIVVLESTKSSTGYELIEKYPVPSEVSCKYESYTTNNLPVGYVPSFGEIVECSYELSR